MATQEDHQPKVERHLARWPIEPGQVRLINHSENRTFRVDAPEGPRALIRVHRPGYQTVAAIASELAWIAALKQSTQLLLPEPIAARDGQFVQMLDGRDSGRLAVAFRYFEGSEPDASGDLVPLFEYLGEAAAHCHSQVLGWRMPVVFERGRWDADTILAPAGGWDDWRRAPGVDLATEKVLSRAEAALREALGAYGQEVDRFGLIHADMRLANVVEHNGTRRLIDFDDMGFGWFMYDFGAAVSFMETSPMVPAWRDAWISGYRRIRPLTPDDIAVLPAMVLLRRFALLAWIGSHSQTPLAQSHAPAFAVGTAELAERFLAGQGMR